MYISLCISLIGHSFSPLLGQLSLWQTSWVDFCRSWMTIEVLDSDSPGWNPEPTLLFTFDLLFNSLEEVGWTEDQRLCLLPVFPYDRRHASNSAQQQILPSRSSAEFLTPWQKAWLKWTLGSVGENFYFGFNRPVSKNELNFYPHSETPWGNCSFLSRDFICRIKS